MKDKLDQRNEDEEYVFLYDILKQQQNIIPTTSGKKVFISTNTTFVEDIYIKNSFGENKEKNSQ